MVFSRVDNCYFYGDTQREPLRMRRRELGESEQVEANSNRSFSFDVIAAILKRRPFWLVAKNFSAGLKCSLM